MLYCQGIRLNSGYQYPDSVTVAIVLNGNVVASCPTVSIYSYLHSLFSTGNRRQSPTSFNKRNDYVLYGPETWTCHKAFVLRRRIKNQEIFIESQPSLRALTVDNPELPLIPESVRVSPTIAENVRHARQK